MKIDRHNIDDILRANVHKTLYWSDEEWRELEVFAEINGFAKPEEGKEFYASIHFHKK